MLQIVTDVFAAPISSGDMSNPLALIVDSAAVPVAVRRLYLHNDDPAVYYTDVSLRVTNIPSGWSIKLLKQELAPTEAEWNAVASGNTITWTSIGEAGQPDTGYQAFWLRWEVPSGLAPTTSLTCKLYVQYVEWMV